jgi:hypothetical protein
MRSMLRFLGFGIAAAFSIGSALAQDAASPGATGPEAQGDAAPAPATSSKSGWPCEQPERSEISVGSVWQGPDPAAAEEIWDDDPAVVALIAQVAPRRTPQDQAIAAIHRFASGTKENRATVLTALFAGLFETLNHERSEIIRGIRHFNSRQDNLAQRIQEGWKQMDAIDATSTDPAIVEKRMALQQTIDWDSRIFDDRERLLPDICQQPSVVEQRLYALSRAIQEDLATPAPNP